MSENGKQHAERQGWTVAELAEYLAGNGLKVQPAGDGNTMVYRVNTLEFAQEGDISFLANRRYLKLIDQTQASAIILPELVNGPDRLAQLTVDDPYYAFMLIMVLMHGYRSHPFDAIDDNAAIHPTARVGEGARIANGVTILRNVVVGTGAVIYPGCFIGPDCRIGDGLTLYPNVAIYDQTTIGSNVTIHAGSIIGQDGFGYATHEGIHHKIPQVGNVVIEDDVEIGANCTIDRATIGSTVIGQGTKTSDLVAIGHGTRVGPHCLLVAQVGIAGSVKVGHHVTFAGQVGVNGHIRIGNGVRVGAKAGVVSDVEDNEVLLGQPAVPIQEAKRRFLMLDRLPDMREQLKRIQKHLDHLDRRRDRGRPWDRQSGQTDDA